MYEFRFDDLRIFFALHKFAFMNVYLIYKRNIHIQKLPCIIKIRPEHKKQDPLQFRIQGYV